MQETLRECCETCHKEQGQIVSGETCVWQWCRVPEGCQTANGTVPEKTCMTSRQEVFPIDWQNGTVVSGLHIMSGAHQEAVPEHYSIVPGRDFIQSLSSWDLASGACPAQFWMPSTAKCNVTGNLTTVAAACNALPTCNGFVFAASVKNRTGPAMYGLLKSGQMDPYCLKPNPRTATYYRLNPNGSAYSAVILPAPPPEAQAHLLTLLRDPHHFPVLGVALGAAAVVALVAVGALLCCWCRTLRRAHDAERAAAKLEADSLEHGFSGPLSKKDSDSSAGGDRLGSLGSTRGGSLPRMPNNLARVSLTEVMGRVGPGAAKASPVNSVLMQLPWNDWEIGPNEIGVLQREDGTDWKLGEGASGSVFKAVRGGQVVAVKIFHEHSGRGMSDSPAQQRRMAQGRDDLRREISLLRSLHDRNIVNFVGAAIWDGVAVLVTDFLERGDLYQALAADKERRFSWHRRKLRTGQFVPNTGMARKVALDIARGLHYLHSRNPKVVHFDVKSPNILLARDYTAKLADVGLAKLMMRDCLSTLRDVGTFAWAAPEVLLGQKCTEKVDIFSFGVILWELSTGEAPGGRQLRNLRVPEEAPPEVDAIIESCLGPDADARPSALDLVGFFSAWGAGGEAPPQRSTALLDSK
ncbi:hypothetical protein WJX81_005925 [Elliptochloris bilobata]|uniref:Protein kinase domain-containing protein n=1 Tax=Elliptochloris bilobata TaxID=381761 RepID=A0AAW1RCU8_9CHLO